MSKVVLIAAGVALLAAVLAAQGQSARPADGTTDATGDRRADFSARLDRARARARELAES